ncbi:MAG: glycine zipper 2TM domain-containing protein [Litoreibacter sp.]|nr:glycine zipper 2TM domain-containing protein [Litoreibacter sp.]
MSKNVVAAVGLAVLTVVGCENMTEQEQVIFGGLAGAAVGGLTAKALDADDDWIIISALAGAAVGTMVARNQATQECAYARGDGTYRVGPCP